MSYRSLDPRTQLEQTVAADLKAALEKRGCAVVHYGTPAAPAPASSPCDISVAYGPKTNRRHLMVEVAQRVDASELQSIISHLDGWTASRGPAVDLLYSGRSTSARMARLIRNENERRASLGLPGRILFLKLDDLEQFLQRWKGLPSTEAPAGALTTAFGRFAEWGDDLMAAEVFRQCVFPDWTDKKNELSAEAAQRLASQQERLKKDIQRLENKLRESGITGPRSHKFLIYLFFMALYEDKRGKDTRATKQGFLNYKEGLPNAAKNSPEYKDRTVHHLLYQEILEDSDVKEAGIPSQYERIDLSDDFVLQQVIPIFENYSFADAAIDAIGAVFEALARRAEKDNRIGQFFTPEAVVEATCRLVGLRPTDLVADPACGTGRFLIHAMSHMTKQAGSVAGKTREQATRAIKQKLLLGCDIDPWIAVIAKMNMYIHGDGKSNIRRANGLTIASVPSFAPQRTGTLSNSLDVVLTNPPLGDIDFRTVADGVARELIAAKGDDVDDAKEVGKRAAEWSNETFSVVPHTVTEEVLRQKASEKVGEWTEKAIQHKMAGNTNKEVAARKRVAEWEAKRGEADKAIGAGNVHYEPAGRTAKGGALFLSSIVRSLKKVRDASQPVEWRGGIVGIVIDEAVLNTREYAVAREFIRTHYFLKAVVSLPRDAFADLAKTTAKTSILVLVRKDDVDVVQREPVFFARSEHIGPIGSDLTRPNDLLEICGSFDTWRSAIQEACNHSGNAMPQASEQQAAASQAVQASKGVGQISLRQLDAGAGQERLDEAYWCMKELIASIAAPVPLSTFATLVDFGRVPPEQSIYSFASVSRAEGRVRPKGDSSTMYSADDLQEVREGDILVSGIDLVHGSVGVVGGDCDGMVVSKEYFILQPKAGFDPHWLVSLLRTRAVRRIIEGTITGTSNRTRVESPSVLMQIQLPAAPSKKVRDKVGDALRSAHLHHAQMISAIRNAERAAAKAAALPFSQELDEDLSGETTSE